MEHQTEPVKAATNAVGGYAQLALLIGVTKSAVYQWKRVPAERVIAVEAVSGVPRQQLRPDLYPAE
jgi:DNA-binding transcriptional regulator YdaS (Cro superfamily)